MSYVVRYCPRAKSKSRRHTSEGDEKDVVQLLANSIVKISITENAEFSTEVYDHTHVHLPVSGVQKIINYLLETQPEKIAGIDLLCSSSGFQIHLRRTRFFSLHTKT